MRVSLFVVALMLGCGSSASAGEPSGADSSGSESGSDNTPGHSTGAAIDPVDGSPGATPASNAPLEPGMLPAPPDVAAIPAGAAVTPTGLGSRVLRPGSGTAHPGPTSRVRVHYSGWTTDGRMFDSSRTRGAPAEFPLSGVIAGWTEGVQLMVVGEERRFWIPASLAYGATPRAGAPAGMLVFDVELLAIDP